LAKVSRQNLPGYSPLGVEKPEDVAYNIDLLLHYVDHNIKHNVHRVITGSYNNVINELIEKQ
jgi:hypothetical protein